MTATDELRRMLDERGLEYASSASGRSVYISHNTTAFANYSEDTLDVSMRNLTPQQAIEATLGRGTCHDEGDPGDFFCSECGVRMFTETNDTYTMIASDERTIIKHPNYCPNCGRRVVAGDA